MDSFEKLKALPSKDKFYSSLTQDGISDKNYEHVVNVWKTFDEKSMKNYNDLYLKCNVFYLWVCLKVSEMNL